MTKKEITIEELKKKFPNWKIESQEQEKKALEFYKEAQEALLNFTLVDFVEEDGTTYGGKLCDFVQK